MRIHFIAAESKIVEDIERLRTIISILHKKGHSLGRDWVEPAYARRVKNIDYHDTDWRKVHRESIEALTKSGLVIAEVSNESVSLGYQIAVAIRQKKPVLLLRHIRANEDMFVTGIEEPHISHKTYDTQQELEEVISKFIDDNIIEGKDVRFNFFADRKIYNYLRWASFKTGKTKAEIVREIVKRDIEQGDY